MSRRTAGSRHLCRAARRAVNEPAPRAILFKAQAAAQVYIPSQFARCVHADGYGGITLLDRVRPPPGMSLMR